MTDSRIRELDRRLGERYLSHPQERWAFGGEAQFRAEVQRIRQLLTATDAAMDAEGIPLEARERVIYRLLYGEAPHAYEEPDWRDAARRSKEREEAIQAAMRTEPRPSFRGVLDCAPPPPLIWWPESKRAGRKRRRTRSRWTSRSPRCAWSRA